MAKPKAAGGEQPRFPSSLEAAQGRTRAPLIGVKIPLLGRRSLGSPWPRFVRMEWTTADLDPDEIAWADVPGNPRSHRRPRGWSFSVLGMEMDAMFDVIGNNRITSATQAIICEDGGEIKVGTNPKEGGHLFGGKTLEETKMFLAAVRHGRDDLRATMAYSLEGELYVPEQSPVVLAENVPGAFKALDPYPRTMMAG